MNLALKLTLTSKLLLAALFAVIILGAAYFLVLYQNNAAPTSSYKVSTSSSDQSKKSTKPARTSLVSCGTVTSHSESTPALSADAKQVEDCFLTNFNDCTPATLNLTITGTDSGTNDSFSINGVAGLCALSGYSQSYSTAKGAGTKIDFICQKLNSDKQGLHVQLCKSSNSSANDITIPAP